MSIEIRDENYYIAQWFLDIDPRSPESLGFTEDESGNQVPYYGVDVMGIAWREPQMAEDEWLLRYRFRYRRDEKKDYTSQDVKSWYEARMKGSEEEVMKTSTEVFATLGAQMGGELTTQLIKGNGAKFAEIMTSNPPPYVNMSSIPIQEAIDKGLISAADAARVLNTEEGNDEVRES
jgi:hypothetical protein